jgi:hypothetical protein
VRLQASGAAPPKCPDEQADASGRDKQNRRWFGHGGGGGNRRRAQFGEVERRVGLEVGVEVYSKEAIPSARGGREDLAEVQESS